MLANHSKHEDVEISQCIWPDQQAGSEPTLAVPFTSLSPKDTSGLLSTPTPSQASSSLHQRALRYLERKRLRQERAHTQIQATTITDAASQSLIFSPEKSDFHGENSYFLSSSVEIRFITSVSPYTSAFLSSQDNSLMHTAQRRRKFLQRHRVRKFLHRDRLSKRRSSEHFWITFLSTALALVLIFLTAISGSTFFAYHFYVSTQQQYTPQVLTLHSLIPRDNLRMYDMNGVPIGQLTGEGLHTSVTYNQIASYMIDATVSTEDKGFWTNAGIDIRRILQAAVQDLEQRHVVEGGSTITQQLIKNLVLHNPAQDITRKLQELALTPEINSRYSKKDLMEMYLNSVYYGEQAYGVDAAASVYFGLQDQPDKPAALQLDLAQAALLAGLPSAPNGYDPWIYFESSINRLKTILTLMHRDGYITDDQAQAALKEAQSPGFLKHPTDQMQPAPHFFNFVVKQLQEQFHMTRQQLALSGMHVYTTLDVKLQNQILQIAQAQIANLQDSNVTNAAEVLIDYHTGAIRTLLGNVHPDMDQFDVATEGYRQPGSSFKPYVYVTAFQQGVSPGQAVDDAPISIPQAGQPPFAPHNYFGNFNGHMTLRCALQNSLNIPAVKVIEHVGVQDVANTMQKMGITDYKGDLNTSIALGSLDLHLLDHTSAFGTFANGGIHVPYYTIQRIEFADTHQVFEHPQNSGTRAISPQLAYMMTDVLSDNDDRVPEFGYCSSLNLRTDGSCYGPILPSAAKTGTTDDFRDTWTVGYTSDYVLGVWVGNNNNSPMININGITGAAPIWHDGMLAAEAGHSPQPFTNPGDLVKVEQHYSDGVATHDWYLAGQVPTSVQSSKAPPKSISILGRKENSHNQLAPATAQPYCSSYSFDFQPPAASKQPTNGLSPLGQDWW
ncbi:MAG: transglycosylase domain-containing protein [Chloroflexi bacterium]|nr:transglycosylase domain-containing protein [Chloroflexota bacterium]